MLNIFQDLVRKVKTCYNNFMEKFERKENKIDLLEKRLKDAGINIELWGKGTAKTLDYLEKEIEAGETELIFGKNGELLRKVVVTGADVLYTSPEGKKYRLREDKQVFKDGRERHRDLGRAVSEKMKSNEDPEQAIVRGIQEELGITGPIKAVATGTEIENIDSPSYPGLSSQYTTHEFEVNLSKEQFKLDGYVEVQAGLTTYFVWEEIK